MIGERIRLLLACGDQQRAFEIGRQEQLLGAPIGLAPQPDSTTRDEMRAVTWFRFALARGETTQAIELGQTWKRFTTKAGAFRSAMRWEILLARAYAADGQTPRAQRELRSALTRSVTSNFIRSFLDEGEQIIQLLTDQLNASQIQTGATDRLVAQLLRASSIASEQISSAPAIASDPEGCSSIGRLTRIQVEILQMASAGLQNREIAQRIGMTEGSVKWYMQQIFNKIGVRKRAGALERAKSMRLV